MWLKAKPLVLAVSLLCVLGMVLGCGEQATEAREEDGPMPQRTIEEVLSDHTESLMSLPGVVATAQGDCSGRPCIRVFVTKATPQLLKRIPPNIEGYEVAVDETGEIRATDTG